MNEEQLKRTASVLVDAVYFYADSDNWRSHQEYQSPETMEKIDFNDCKNELMCGGDKARESIRIVRDIFCGTI